MDVYVVFFKDNDGVPSESYFSGKVFSSKIMAMIYCDHKNEEDDSTLFFFKKGEIQ